MSGGGGDNGRRSVRFGLLGPLLIRVGDVAVVLGSPKLRVLLATLLLRAGQPVSITELAEVIWGSTQPGNPRRAVHLCVARLRAQLATEGLVVTCVGGYRIDASSDDVDLGRFEYWLARAGRAAKSGDLDREAAALTSALTEWRGEPLVDIPSETLRREAVSRINELHIEATERYVDVRLRQGNHAELVGDLVTLTTRYPFRERLWGQLMTALFHSGRRADALEAYHTVRKLLADELGIDPGEDLRQLHAAILTGRLESTPVERATLPPPLVAVRQSAASGSARESHHRIPSTVMGELILIRHGETAWSRTGQHCGRTDLPLTEAGEAAAQALAPRLAHRELVAVFSSPLSRAMRTAELAGLTGVKPDPDLLEWDYGGDEGMTAVQIQETRPGWNLWRDGVVPGDADHPGEQLQQVATRTDAVLDRVRPLLNDGDVAIVAHGHLQRVLTARWLGLDPSASRLFGHPHPATISILGLEHEQPVISAWSIP